MTTDTLAAATIPTSPSETPWAPQTVAAAVVTNTPVWDRALPFVGPVLLLLVWDMVVRFGLVKAILLPPPIDTVLALVGGLAGGPLLTDFGVTLWRTVQAFLIAASIGVPLGIALGSNEKSYRSVEFFN